ncbi:hypothetical protein HUS70_18520 [Pandoraea nosoerga]|uniref:Uncharacterized protein n=1 Tax=Pandoraea nosoerga TaxID=2508296 RepID=A0A5E4XHL0_9BURK|nr:MULTISPECIES: hypothetical protein [Pandoraea]MBN4668084.1 hypothetical protein [Pandoraea nosoerga]MBN4677907.1 hypothetical protein [Pandoraea nosoerga]MBN4683111.1 hypothetical protein [Pandoraea nosoerga]MBN4746600.1 hypothetical protein [Pandoraea nosoerga]VVE35610.1 hypothetical protein PNO31109_03869 [Pandoraea nosoerga]
MSTVPRSAVSADPFAGLSGERVKSHHDAGARRSGYRDESDERPFTLARERVVRVSGPVDVLRWLRVWRERQSENWEGVSSLRVAVHGGALDGLVVEARRGRLGITVSLICVRLALYRRLLAHRGELSRALTSRLGLAVTVEVQARYVP